MTGMPIRARISYKGKNYEKAVRNKEEAKRWRAKMQTDLERAPIEANYVRGCWNASLESGSTTVKFSSNQLDEVIDWLLRTKAEISAGVYVNEQTANTTLSQYIAEWRKTKVRAQGRTMQLYDLLIKNQIIPFLGEQKLASITTIGVRKWVGELSEAGFGAPTINKASAVLKQIMKTAFDDELIRRNPVTGIELPAVIPKEKRPLTVGELEALAQACKGFETFVMLLGLMGLRVGEARALTVRDVDCENWELTVRTGLTHDATYKRITSTTKTKKVRHIPIPEPLREGLQALVDGQSQITPVFRGAKGEVLNDSWFRKKIFAPAISELGLGYVTIHSLRHTCASLLISSGATITTVSRILGHSSVVQTLSTYSHFYKEDVEASMTKLSELYLKKSVIGDELALSMVA